jgi:hypothetical protein
MGGMPGIRDQQRRDHGYRKAPGKKGVGPPQGAGYLQLRLQEAVSRGDIRDIGVCDLLALVLLCRDRKGGSGYILLPLLPAEGGQWNVLREAAAESALKALQIDEARGRREIVLKLVLGGHLL